jgi:hypothetical protein
MVPAVAATAEDGRAATVPSCDGIIYDAANPNHVLYPDDATFNADGFAVIDARGTNVEWVVMENPAFNWPTFDKGLAFYGGAGDELVCGADGRNDFIKAGGGDDTVFGNDGYVWQNPYTPANIRVKRTNWQTLNGIGTPDPWVSDIIMGQMGDDYLDAGYSANDVPPFGAFAAQDVLIIGGAGDDEITGSLQWDFLRGRAGADVIDGVDDLDQVYGDMGDDTLYGGTGRNEIRGGQGDDLLYGGDASQLNVFVDAPDLMVGGDGNDRLYGEEGDDEMRGMAGNDLLDGDSGDDWVCGNTGADDLYGDLGNDNLFANGCPYQADGLVIGTPGATATNVFTLAVQPAPYDWVATGTDFVPESPDWIYYTFLPAAATFDVWTVNFGSPGGVNVVPTDYIDVCGQTFDYVGAAPVVPHTIWADGTDDNDNAIRLANAINSDGANGCTAVRSGKVVTITNDDPGIRPETVVYTPFGGGSVAPTVTQTVFGQDGLNNCAIATANYDVCVLIDVNVDATHTNLVNAVNGGLAPGKYVYTPGFGPHTTVEVVAANLLTDRSTWAVMTPGAAGNTFEGEEASTGFWQSPNPSKYTGGVDPTGFSTHFDWFRGHDGAIDELFGGAGNNNYFSCDPTGLRDPVTNALLGYVNEDQAYYDTVNGGADRTWGISVYVAGVTPDNHFPNSGFFTATFPGLFPCMDLYGLP